MRYLLFLILIFQMDIIEAQKSFQDSSEIKYNEKILKINDIFNVAVKYWETPGIGFNDAMKKFIEFGNSIEPFMKVSPTISKTEYRKYSYDTKDVVRRYVRFMFNCNRVDPNLCATNDCMNLAWNMTENIKSLNFRYELLNGLFDKESESNKEILERLFVKLENEPNKEKLRNIEKAITEILPEYKYLSGLTVPLDEIKRVLKPNEVLVSFFMTDNRRPVYAWKISKTKTEFLTFKINSADLFLRIEATKAAFEKDTNRLIKIKQAIEREKMIVDTRKSYTPYFTSDLSIKSCIDVFNNSIIKPLNLLAGQKLVFAVDQNISSLPFDLIKLPSNKYFFEEFDLTYVPSAKIFYYLRTANTIPVVNNFNKYAGFGYSNNGNLRYANIEIEGVSDLFDNSKKILDAKESDIYNILNKEDFDVLHFSTHGLIKSFTKRNDDFLKNFTIQSNVKILPSVIKSNYLIYGSDFENDGKLESSEILSKIKNIPPLVLLSGCETAPSADIKQYFDIDGITISNPVLHKEYGSETKYTLSGVTNSSCVCSYGETFSNLTSAFFSKGAKKIIANQWSVNSEESSRIVQTFFEKLKETKNVNKALRFAKKEFSSIEGSSWSSFIIISD